MTDFQNVLTFVAAYLFVSFLTTYLLWGHYLAVMGLSRAKRAGLLTPIAIVLGTPILIKGYLLDAWVNWTVMTVLLLELPREATVTSRLKRHNRGPLGWRKRVAQWFEPLLDPYDPDGDHI